MKISGPYRMPKRASPGRRRRLSGLALTSGTSASIAALVQQIAQQYGLNPGLALAVAQHESSLNPNAVSSEGAQGVMQLMPATAAQFGVTNPFDPVQNITAGVQYLLQLLNQFGGDVASALAAYNWGPANVTKAQSQYGANWLSAAPASTQAYVFAIAGVAPGQPPAPIASPVTTTTITVDATTGEPVSAETSPAATPDTVTIGGVQIPTSALLAAGIVLGVYIAAQFLGDL
jgi:hypothetical protein